MWGYERTGWIAEVAQADVRKYDIDEPRGNIKIPESDSTLWRYMDVAKLLALVGNKSLFLSSIEKLGDPYEGQWSDRTFAMINDGDELWVQEEADQVVIRDLKSGERESFPMIDGETAADAIARWNQKLRSRARPTYVNCWYQDEGESEAMWRLFTGESYGIAVRTTPALLVGSFTEELPDYLGCVEYLDFDKEAMPVSELPPVFYKRRAFMHEREVRVVAAPARRRDWKGNPNERLDGVEYPVDPGLLIEEIVVSPYSPGWLLAVVDATVKSLGVENNIVRDSSLRRSPPSKRTSVSVRRLEAHFAFLDTDAAVPLRIWTRTRKRADRVARDHWGLNATDSALQIWKQSECDEGYAKQPTEYVHVADPLLSDHAKGLDPEGGTY